MKKFEVYNEIKKFDLEYLLRTVRIFLNIAKLIIIINILIDYYRGRKDISLYKSDFYFNRLLYNILLTILIAVHNNMFVLICDLRFFRGWRICIGKY